jgi:hypothetical protein
LRTLAARDWPDLPVPTALGEAPAEARAFAAAARAPESSKLRHGAFEDSDPISLKKSTSGQYGSPV